MVGRIATGCFEITRLRVHWAESIRIPKRGETALVGAKFIAHHVQAISNASRAGRIDMAWEET
jgi:hypothetical protein